MKTILLTMASVWGLACLGLAIMALSQYTVSTMPIGWVTMALGAVGAFHMAVLLAAAARGLGILEALEGRR